jgi:hypothetical protein
MHKKKAKGAALIWALILTGSFLVPTVASANPPSLDLTIGDLQLTLNSDSDPIQYLTFTSPSHQEIPITVVSSQTVEVSLASAAQPNTVISDELITPADADLVSLATQCQNVQAINPQASSPECNLFELRVEIASDDQNFEDLSFVFHLLRKYAGSTQFDVDIDWYMPGEVPQDEPIGSSISMQQGWYRLPSEENVNFPAINTWNFLAGFEDSSDASYQLGEYVPIFGNKLFEAYWFFNPTVIQIFDNLLIPDECPDDVAGEYCLSLVAPGTQLYEGMPPLGKGIGSEEYFLTLPTSSDFTDSADDNDPNSSPQGIKVLWPFGSTNRTATLYHQDHRIPQGYGTPLEQIAETNFLEADEYDAVPDTQVFTTFPLGDEVICSPNEVCKRVWALNVEFTDMRNRAHSFHINLIVFDASVPEPVFTFPWYPDNPNRFTQNDGTPISVEWDVNDVDVDRRNFWLFAPDITDFDYFIPEEEGYLSYARKPNHNFLGWNTVSNLVSNAFSKPYFPLVQDEVLYWAWQPQISGASGNSAPPVTAVTPVPDVQQTNTPTKVNVTYKNGITTIVATVPSIYANRLAKVQQRFVRNGRISYKTLSRAWVRIEKTDDKSQAVVTFKFAKKLSPTDRIKLAVREATIIHSFGDGRPTWR